MEVKMVNLLELIKYHPYHESTFARYANVTLELLSAAIRGDEELEPYEIFRMASYSNVPMGVISLPRMIWLDRNSYRHRAMVSRLAEKLDAIRVAAMEGNEDSCYFIQQGGLKQGDELVSDFQKDGKVSYCRYLGTLAFADIYGGIRKVIPPRGLKTAGR